LGRLAGFADDRAVVLAHRARFAVSALRASIPAATPRPPRIRQPHPASGVIVKSASRCVWLEASHRQVMRRRMIIALGLTAIGLTDAGDRFIKRVVAIAGETVCGRGDTVTIGSLRIQRQRHDSSGHALPRWGGCRVLSEGELFLLGDTPDSFDSRYFGVVTSEEIEGVWRPL
jgi:type IV secretory pathway protease TraF